MAGFHSQLDRELPVVATDTDNSVILRGKHTPEQLEVARAVGYHNYFMVGVHDAVDLVSEKCPPGWAATRVGHRQNTVHLADAIRVGQVRVHSGDSDYILVVYRTQ